jgi:hypothetical protein
VSDTDKNTGSTDTDAAKKAHTESLPDGSSSEGSEDTDRDTASGGPAD